MNTAEASLYRWLTLALAIAVVDQLSKYGATALLEYAHPVPVLPGFNFTLLHNTGAAFSLLHDQSGWQRWFFSAVAFVVAIAVVVWMSRLGPKERWLSIALSLILGGAAGNLIDRLVLGYVVDFIQLYYGRWSWPAFNIADSAISVGAVMMIVHSPRMSASEEAQSAKQ